MFLDKYIEAGWALAFRKTEPGKQLFLAETNGVERKFRIIKNPWGYWCADPFLFQHEGVEYVFCEAYDIFKDKGIIAYRIIRDDGSVSGVFPCLETEGHMSYPNVFRYQGEICMIPETSDAEELSVYRAVRFPDQWEMWRVLLKDVAACDANFLVYHDETYLFTLVFDRRQKQYVYEKLYAYRKSGDTFVEMANNPVVWDAKTARNAGKMFQFEGAAYRVSQDCKSMYGEKLNFLKIENLQRDCYQERLVKTVSVKDIAIHSRNRFEGIHTYNFDDKYEIIDLQRVKWCRLERFLYLLINKIRRILNYKLKSR